MKIIARTTKELLTIIRLEEQSNKEAKQSEQEYNEILINRYYDEHPLDGNAAYARMQGDDRGAIGETESDYIEVRQVIDAQGLPRLQGNFIK